MENNNKHINDLKSTFKVPKNYFDDLEDKILSQIKLESLEKKNNFKTPSGYFNKSIDQLLPKKENVSKVIPFNRTKSFKTIRTLIAVAAILVLAVLLYPPKQTRTETDNTSVLAEIESIDFFNNLDAYTNSAVFEEEEEYNLIAALNFDESPEEKDFYYFNEDITINETSSDEIDEYMDSDFELDFNF